MCYIGPEPAVVKSSQGPRGRLFPWDPSRPEVYTSSTYFGLFGSPGVVGNIPHQATVTCLPGCSTLGNSFFGWYVWRYGCCWYLIPHLVILQSMEAEGPAFDVSM